MQVRIHLVNSQKEHGRWCTLRFCFQDTVLLFGTVLLLDPVHFRKTRSVFKYQYSILKPFNSMSTNWNKKVWLLSEKNLLHVKVGAVIKIFCEFYRLPLQKPGNKRLTRIFLLFIRPLCFLILFLHAINAPFVLFSIIAKWLPQGNII